MPSVLLVVANRSYGGAERHVVDLSGELARRGHRVVCLYPVGTGLGARLEPSVESREIPGLRSPWAFGAALRRAVRDFEPAVVHLHSPRAAFLGRLVIGLGRRRRPMLVSTAHGWIPQRLLLRRVFEAVYLWTTPLEDATIAVSRDTARRFGRWGARVRVVPNGIAPPGTQAPPGGRPSVFSLGFLGRLTQEKNFPLALEAFTLAKSELARGNPGLVVELHVYGDGPLLDEAKGLAAAAGGKGLGGGGVFFHGWLPQVEVAGVLGELSALLLTSREEGLPYVLLEALAAGCPVVATAVGGIPEVIEPGRSGFLAAPGDAAEVAQAVVTLALNPVLAHGISAGARRRAGEFSLEAMADGVEEVYRAAEQRARA